MAAEVWQHTLVEAPEKGSVRDAAIITEHQRLTHYGVTGFGTVAAFAKTLKLSDDGERLSGVVKETHGADDLVSHLAEAGVNVAAAA